MEDACHTGGVLCPRTGLVDIVRDFLEAHELMRRLLARFRSGELAFAELGALVSSDEGSVLFRLKERCHALFRPGDPARAATDREALFDLAIGSLFHEAMKFRENYYQREVYGPRMRELRTRASTESDALFREFEKMLAAGSARLEEGLQEAEVLLERTREQLKLLLAERRDDGHVARFLLENAARVEQVFGLDLSALLADLHGDAAAGYALAGHSYVASGYFESAERAFTAAIARGGDREELERLSAYARGMVAYLSRDYAAAADQLGRWLDAGPAEDGDLVDLARAAVSRIGQLVSGSDRERVVAAATALLERLPAPPAPTR